MPHINVLLLNELQKQERFNDQQQRRIEMLEERLNELLGALAKPGAADRERR